MCNVPIGCIGSYYDEDDCMGTLIFCGVCYMCLIRVFSDFLFSLSKQWRVETSRFD